ncbi:MAG: hypothetical protein KAT74_11850, partial [Candidatus Cloacimonetes bacterium]|nr:hypothetical protein [Candidatus Cloacimonadota bacterium]
GFLFLRKPLKTCFHKVFEETKRTALQAQCLFSICRTGAPGITDSDFDRKRYPLQLHNYKSIPPILVLLKQSQQLTSQVMLNIMNINYLMTMQHLFAKK